MTLYIFPNAAGTKCLPDKHPDCRHPHAHLTSNGIRLAARVPTLYGRGVPAPRGLLVEVRRAPGEDGPDSQIMRVP